MHKTIIFKSPSAKIIFRVCVGVVLLIAGWVWFFHVTDRADSHNTYSEVIDIVEVDTVRYPLVNTNIIIVYTQNDRYIISIDTRSDEKTDEMVNILTSPGKSFEVLIWEHFPQYFLHRFEDLFWVKQIVNLTDGANTIWSIEKHNSMQKLQRICGWIGFLFVTLFYCGLQSINVSFWDILKRKYRRIKKKIKAKKRKRQNNR